MFGKKLKSALAATDYWHSKYLNERKKRIDLNVRVASLEEINDWLCDENARLKKCEPFTFDKSELRSLKRENADLRAEVTILTVELKDLERKGAKKWFFTESWGMSF